MILTIIITLRVTKNKSGEGLAAEVQVGNDGGGGDKRGEHGKKCNRRKRFYGLILRAEAAARQYQRDYAANQLSSVNNKRKIEHDDAREPCRGVASDLYVVQSRKYNQRCHCKTNERQHPENRACDKSAFFHNSTSLNTIGFCPNNF